MKKIIPIKLNRIEGTVPTKVLEWRLSNQCNFNCSFCLDIFKDGSKKFLQYDQYINSINRLIEDNLNTKVWFQFTGGEPSLYPKLKDLLAHIKSKNSFTSMISNGSRTIRWWKELASENTLDRLYLSYHPEQDPSPDHVIEVNNLMQETNTFVTIFVTTQYHEDLFKKAVDAHRIILDKAVTISSLKPIEQNGKLQPFSKEQMNIIKFYRYSYSKLWHLIPKEKIDYLKKLPWYQKQMEMIFDDNSQTKKTAQHFVENNLNKFQGWECDIGLNQLVVDVDEVYRGMCKEGGLVSKIDSNDWTWVKDKIICGKDSCNCSFDIMANKTKL